MSKTEKLTSLITQSGLSLIGDPVDDPDVSGGFIVFVKATGQTPALIPGLIAKLQKRFIAEGEQVKIVEPKPNGAQIESFLSASIKARLPHLNLDLTVAAGHGQAAIWVGLPVGTLAEDQVAVADAIHRFLSQLGIEDQIVTFKAEKNLPSPTACLRVLRRHAPCSPEALTELLQLPGFDAMTLSEVRRLLDTARRKGQVIRREDGKYILTLQCLMDLGSSRNRFSPDVSRALALRRLGA
ncbi:hypothetical protein [Salipiger abyssi]|uniref:hypothetical protein n=1 Tax=Salipiger abyssi TaxID=1250539 RepID=UPI0012EBB7BF|nr:hypothetical protein [Salipiger abyssi]